MYKKKGYPEKDDLVICTVKNLLPSSVVVDLDEYESKEGMIHVSEIPRRWAKNLRIHMKVGTKCVCRVMGVDKEKADISLSVRSVGAAQNRNKLAMWADEKRANDILEAFAKLNKLGAKEIYSKVGDKILENRGELYSTFVEVARRGSEALEELGVDKDLAKQLTELIEKRIVLPKAEISGTLSMYSNAPDGVDRIKSVANVGKLIAETKKVDFELKYLGAPRYKFRLVADDFKTAEDVLEEIENKMTEYLEKNKGSAKFERED